MADLPDGIDYHAIERAIAWEITKQAVSSTPMTVNFTDEDWLNKYLETYAKAYLAVSDPKNYLDQQASHKQPEQ